MKSKMFFGLMSAICAFVGTTATAGADYPSWVTPEVVRGARKVVMACSNVEISGGGTICTLDGRDPLPFRDVNQKVELSPGEVYELQGRMYYANGSPFFKVDLCAQPWLANEQRRKLPVYPIVFAKDRPVRMRTDQDMRILVRAGATIVNGTGGRTSFVITVEPIVVMNLP